MEAALALRSAVLVVGLLCGSSAFAQAQPQTGGGEGEALFMQIHRCSRIRDVSTAIPRVSRRNRAIQRQVHVPPITRGPHDSGPPGLQCAACHQKKNFAAQRCAGRTELASRAAFAGWEDKTPGELCRSVLDRRTNGNKSVAEIVKHMTDDELVAWGWDAGTETRREKTASRSRSRNPNSTASCTRGRKPAQRARNEAYERPQLRFDALSGAINRLGSCAATYQEITMVTLNVNGKRYDLDVDPETPLLWVMRDGLGLTGTKYGCGMAQCGACTVHVDGQARALVRARRSRRGRARRSRRSKDSIAATARSRCSARGPKLDVVQCGYCQSGQIMSAARAAREEAEADRRRHRRRDGAATSAAAARTCASAPAIHRAAEIVGGDAR